MSLLKIQKQFYIEMNYVTFYFTERNINIFKYVGTCFPKREWGLSRSIKLCDTFAELTFYPFKDFLLSHLHRRDNVQVLETRRALPGAQGVRLHLPKLPRLVRRSHVHECKPGESPIMICIFSLSLCNVVNQVSLASHNSLD